MDTKKYLIVGLILSVFIHVAIFLSLNILSKESKKQKEDKPIYIKIVPYQEKPQKLAQKPSIKKEKKRGIPEKPKKKKEKEVKKIQKKHQKPNKKEIKKQPQKNSKETLPVSNPPLHLKKPADNKIKKQDSKPIQIKNQEEDYEPLIKPVKPVEIDISEDLQQELEKDIVIPEDIFGLKGNSKKTKISAEKEDNPEKKDKEIEDYLKYIKEEFEKNKFYPLKAKKLGIEGTVVIKFTILPDGTIDTNSIQIIYSDSPILSYGAKRIFEKIKKIPKPPPKKEKMTVEIPIEYILIEL